MFNSPTVVSFQAKKNVLAKPSKDSIARIKELQAKGLLIKQANHSSEYACLATNTIADLEELSIPMDVAVVYEGTDHKVVTSKCKRIVLHFENLQGGKRLKVYVGVRKQVVDIANAIFTQQRLSLAC